MAEEYFSIPHSPAQKNGGTVHKKTRNSMAGRFWESDMKTNELELVFVIFTGLPQAEQNKGILDGQRPSKQSGNRPGVARLW